MNDNAKLIDAAPEMLRSLESLTEWLREHTGPSDSCFSILCRAVEVIQMAGGEIR